MSTGGARRVGGLLLTVAGTALLLLGVALASRPEAGSGPPPLAEEPIRVAMDTVSYLLVAVVLGGLAILVWVFWPRRGEDLPALPPRPRRTVLSMALTVAMALVLAIWLRQRRFGPVGGLAPPGSGGGAAAPGAAAPLRGAGAAGTDLLAVAIAAGIVLVVAALAWSALRSPRRKAAAAAVAGLRAVLDDAIEDVLAEADPRRAVVAAWARLERVLARHGLPRHDSEAPFEYAARAGAELDLGGVSLERLASLFEWARFSLHDVTPAMREDALSGLRTVRDGLRGAS